MINNPYYGQEGHGPYEMIDIGTLDLEEGGKIPNCKLGVATHGKLNADKSNAILFTTWYSGTNKLLEQVYTGKGRALEDADHGATGLQPPDAGGADDEGRVVPAVAVDQAPARLEDAVEDRREARLEAATEQGDVDAADQRRGIVIVLRRQ